MVAQVCNHCHRPRSTREFNLKSTGYYQPTCRDCVQLLREEAQTKNRELELTDLIQKLY